MFVCVVIDICHEVCMSTFFDFVCAKEVYVGRIHDIALFFSLSQRIMLKIINTYEKTDTPMCIG